MPEIDELRLYIQRYLGRDCAPDDIVIALKMLIERVEILEAKVQKLNTKLGIANGD